MYRLKVREWKIYIPFNGKQKKAGVTILISYKIDLKVKKIAKDKEGHYRRIKGSIQEEDIKIVNIYAPKAMPKNAQTTTKLQSSHTLAK